MKKTLYSISFLLALFLLSACKSDYEKFFEIQDEAARSPITELETPEGFSFEMNEAGFYDRVKTLNPNQDMCYVWSIDNDTIIGEFHGYKFHEGKLCRYEIWIGEQKGKILSQLVNYYKKIFKDFKYLNLPDLHHPSHIWSKGNMVYRIKELHSLLNSAELIIVECENRPITAIIEREKQEELSSSIDPRVDVKNSEWDGSVKQVKDFLKNGYLRDPDSYESIEWSEVKEKDDGYYVRHKYRGKNGFGGYVVANQLFHLDFSGNVVEVKDLY